MALVASPIFRQSGDDVTTVAVTLAFDSSYPTGGEVITANALGLTRISHAIIPGNLGYAFTWDGANLKVKVYQGDNTNAAAAPGIEVANATDLSALTAVPALFFGV